MQRPQDDAQPEGGDEVQAALAEVIAALEESTRRNQRALAKARAMAKKRTKGQEWREIVLAEERPLVVELMSESLDALLNAGSRLRRAKARALHGEGVTMETIAELFGVTRQRVSSLIRPQGEDGPRRRQRRRGAATETDPDGASEAAGGGH
jgi:hypothetical protein